MVRHHFEAAERGCVVWDRASLRSGLSVLNSSMSRRAQQHARDRSARRPAACALRQHCPLELLPFHVGTTSPLGPELAVMRHPRLGRLKAAPALLAQHEASLGRCSGRVEPKPGYVVLHLVPGSAALPAPAVSQAALPRWRKWRADRGDDRCQEPSALHPRRSILTRTSFYVARSPKAPASATFCCLCAPSAAGPVEHAPDGRGRIPGAIPARQEGRAALLDDLRAARLRIVGGAPPRRRARGTSRPGLIVVSCH